MGVLMQTETELLLKARHVAPTGEEVQSLVHALLFQYTASHPESGSFTHNLYHISMFFTEWTQTPPVQIADSDS